MGYEQTIAWVGDRVALTGRYLAILDTCDGGRAELTAPERQEWERRWRHAYAHRLHAASGQWKWRDYDWHVFSYQYAQAKSGTKAIAAYVRDAIQPLIVIPEAYSCPSLAAFRLTPAAPPSFQDSGYDVLVFPEDLAWTMAFTHEEPACGPYFCMKDWL